MSIVTYDERLTRVKIIVVEPTGAGNVGSIARAMANFGFKDMVLVSPGPFDLTQAASFACNGASIISSMKTSSSFEEAVHDIPAVIGMTRRARDSEVSVPVEKMSDIVLHAANHDAVALVFGRERSGLTREEKGRCTLLSYIDSVDGAEGSLNISHAALLAMHELFRATVRRSDRGSDCEELFSSFERFCSLGKDYEPGGKIQYIFRSVMTRAMLNDDEVKKLTRFFGKYSARQSSEK
jgi:TrmH family RNA methyltransferase